MKTVADLLNGLFDSHRKPNGKKYSNSEVSRALNEQIEASYIGKIRGGKVENPTRQTILLLCQFFSSVGKPVSPSYFFPELAVFDQKQADVNEQIARARGLVEEANRILDDLTGRTTE